MPIQETADRHHAQIPVLVIPIVPAAPEKHHERSSFRLKVNHHLTNKHHRGHHPTSQPNDPGDNA